MTGDNSNQNNTKILRNTKLSQDTTLTGAARFGLPSFEDHTFLIFGYGSILWKQNFDYVDSYACYIKGYTRVFYQGTQEHRGTPGNPGRVVTVLPSDDTEERVYGMAYQLSSDPAELERILGELDVREQEGYDRVSVQLYANQDKEEKLQIAHDPAKKVVVLCYIATEGNEDYLGPDSIDGMAAHILRCAGPSGTNREYLFRLAECLRAMGAVDEHVFAIDAAAKRMLAEQEKKEQEEVEQKQIAATTAAVFLSEDDDEDVSARYTRSSNTTNDSFSSLGENYLSSCGSPVISKPAQHPHYSETEEEEAEPLSSE